MARSRGLFGGARRGTVIPMVGICLIAIVGIAALVVDLGSVLEDRRRLQAAADAAAQAGAIELYNGGTATSATTSARTTAASSGYTHNANGATVTVNTPPQQSTSGFNGDSSCVEVIITAQQPRFFSTIWSSGNMIVLARAVAQQKGGAAGSVGLLALDPHGANALELGSDGWAVVVNGGTVGVNSDHSGAAHVGDHANVIGTTVNVVGGGASTSNTVGGRNITTSAPYYDGPGAGTGNFIINDSSVGHTSTSDPLASYTPPSSAGMPTRTVGSASGAGTAADPKVLLPGNYTSGMVLGGNHYAFTDGIYHISSGNVSFDAARSVTNLPGTGSLIYNASTSTDSRITIGGTDVTLMGMLSGPYQGIAIWQNAANPAVLELQARGNFDINGSIYAPGGRIHVGSDGTLKGTQVIGRWVEVGSRGNLVVDVKRNIPKTRTIRFVE